MNVRALIVLILIAAMARLAQPAASRAQDLASAAQPLAYKIRKDATRSDSNKKIYYKNKLEFAVDLGFLPINIPFPLDFLTGDPYTRTPLNYTLAPIVSGLRWQMGNIHGPLFLRGNTDFTAGPSFTMIPRGGETRYASFIVGMRRNFVQRNWKVVPFVDYRMGLGLIDAKGPQGYAFTQGQDFTFTIMMTSGARYNFNRDYALSFGVGFMHISNAYLSQPKFTNYGINVYGPMVGLDVRLTKPHWHY